MDPQLICPALDKLLVELLPADEMTKAGLWVAATRDRAGLVRARVLRVGPGVYTDKGEIIEVAIPVGAIVIFPKTHMIEITLDAEDTSGKHAFINAASVLATITEPVEES